MYFSRELLITVFILATLAGCSTNPVASGLKFDSLIIHNSSNMALKDVKIKVENTRALAYCSLILPKSSCSTGFPDKHYQGNPIYISWTHNRKSRMVGPVMVELPQKIYSDQSASALLEYSSLGQVSARFVY